MNNYNEKNSFLFSKQKNKKKQALNHQDEDHGHILEVQYHIHWIALSTTKICKIKCLHAKPL